MRCCVQTFNLKVNSSLLAGKSLLTGSVEPMAESVFELSASRSAKQSKPEPHFVKCRAGGLPIAAQLAVARSTRTKDWQ